MSHNCRLFTLSSTVIHEEKTGDRIGSLFGSHNITPLKTPVPTSKIIKTNSLDSPQQQKYMLERKWQSNPQGRSSAHLCVCMCTRARSWNGYVWNRLLKIQCSKQPLTYKFFVLTGHTETEMVKCHTHSKVEDRNLASLFFTCVTFEKLYWKKNLIELVRTRVCVYVLGLCM